MRTSDDHASQYLKLFTLVPLDRISQIISEHMKTPENRLAQRILAEEVVSLIHGSGVAEKCKFQTSVLFPAPITTPEGIKIPNWDSKSLIAAFGNEDSLFVEIKKDIIADLSLARLLRDIELVDSISCFLFN
jgi:tyrosyl-tRNA synthetase